MYNKIEEKIKQTKGITLIALVITIIVLLILAGVSIATLTGENGILKQAKNAANRTEEERILEEIKLAVSAYESGVYAKTETRNLSEYLSDELKLDTIRETNYGTLVFKVGKKVVTVYKNGTLEIKEYQSNTLANNAPLVESQIDTEMTEDTGFLTDDGIARKYVKSIIFDTTNSKPSNYSISWDVSELKESTVMAYATGDETNGYDVTIVADGEIYLPENSTSLFEFCGYNENLPEYEVYFSGVNTSKVTNAHNMFCRFGYYSMTNFFIGEDIDVSNVINMEGMFGFCGYTSMQVLNLGENFNTKSAENMASMFWNCGYTSMETIILGNNFDTSNVKNMSGMFGNCGYTSMKNLNLGTSFNTSKVTNMNFMFLKCGYMKMETLDLGDKFNTQNVTIMNGMFNQCGYMSMATLDLKKHFNTSNVTNMQEMFCDCGYTLMTELDLGEQFDTSNVINMEAIFARCGYMNMEILYLGDKFNTQNVTNTKNAFVDCGYMKMNEIDLGNAFSETSKLVDIVNVLQRCGTSTCKYYVASEKAQNWLLNLNSSYRRNTNWNTEYIIVR